MSVTTTLAALQALHRSLAGVVTASDVYPARLNAADLPQVVVWSANATWARGESGLGSAPRFQLRHYKVQVFIAPVAQNIQDDVMQLQHQLQQTFGEAYTTPANIGLTNGTYQATIIIEHGDLADTGDGTLTWAGVQYHGFEFTIPVLEKSA